MPEITKRIGLKKPLGTENFNRASYSENLDILEANVETTTGAQSKVDAHANKKDNPHDVTKAQIGLSNVDNVKQATKVEFDAFKNTTTSQLAETAKQTDLEATKANVADLQNNKAEKTVVFALAVEKATKAEVEVERQRINGILSLPEGSTSNDARLEDIAIAANGITYSSPGDAVRAQINTLNTKKVSLVDSVIPKAKTINSVIAESVEYGYFYDSITGNKTVASSSWWVHPIIPISQNTTYRKDDCQLALYDENRIFISYVLFGTLTFTTPSNAAYVGICANANVNTAGLYKSSEYEGVYVKGENLYKPDQIENFSYNVKRVVATDFIKREEGKNLYDKDGEGITIVKGYYVAYNTGVVTANVSQQYGIIYVTPGQQLAISITSNVHIAFFSSDVINTTTYISGELNQPTVTPPAGAVIMTVSCRQDVADQLQVEIGTVPTDYEPYQYGLGTDSINDGAVTLEKLDPSIASIIDSKEVLVGVAGGYTSLLQAIKENPGKNVKFKVYGVHFDLYQEYIDYYGPSYFDNYTGYQTSDPFDRGLHLEDGVEVIGVGLPKITFDYDGGNTLVHRWFAPINPTQNNKFIGFHVKIADGICRYGIHDDFAYAPGNNLFKNCIFEGASYLNTFMGCGFGMNNSYEIVNCLFINAGGVNIAYHNNVAAGAKNTLRITNCHCNGAIRGASYGASEEISQMLVTGCRADSISVINTDDTGHNIDNIELIAWNNEIF